MKKFHMIIGILGVLILAGGIYALNSGAFDDTVSSSIFASNDITSNIDSVDFDNKISNNREQSINTKSDDEDVYISSSNPNFNNIGFINPENILDIVQLEDGKFHVSSADPNIEDMITDDVEDIYKILKSSDKKYYINSSATLPPSQESMSSMYQGGIVDKYWWKDKVEFFFVYTDDMTDEEIAAMRESERACAEANNYDRQYGWMEIPGSNGKNPNMVFSDSFDNAVIHGKDLGSNSHLLDVDSNKPLLDNSNNRNNEIFDGVIIN